MSFTTLVNRRHFGKAYRAARESARLDPKNHNAWYRLALVANLTGRHREAVRAGNRAVELGCGALKEGDVLRDHALWAIRHRQLEQAAEYVVAASRLHHNDLNRVACLTMVQARLCYAHADYWRAISLHEKARETWRHLTRADPQWIYNNDCHLLKALVACHGPDDERVRALMDHIQESCPPGAKNRSAEARLMLRLWRFGWRGEYVLSRLEEVRQRLR